MKVVLLMGSESDKDFAKKITDRLDEFGLPWEQHAALSLIHI